MKPTFRLVVAFCATLLVTGTVAAKEATSSLAEETAVVGPEAAAVLLGAIDEEAVAGSRAATVLLDASKPAETPATQPTSSSQAAKPRRAARSTH